MSNEEKLFLGPNEVEKIEPLEQKTPAGNVIVRVLFKSPDAFSDTMPLAVFNLSKTTEPIDYTTLRDRQHAALIIELTRVMMEADVKFGNVRWVCKSLQDKLEAVFDRTTQFLLSGDDKRFIPGTHPMIDASLLQAEAILTKIQPDGKSV